MTSKPQNSMPNNLDPRKLSQTGQSLYELLGVEKTATQEDIRRAYRKLALKCHPDKNPNDPTAADKFAEINRANNILNDSVKRKFYDEHGAFGLYLYDTMGPETAAAYFKFNNPCFKCLLVSCFLLTGCCCCCCCCLCCACFRKRPTDEEFCQAVFESDEEQEINNRTNPVTTEPINDSYQGVDNGAQSPNISYVNGYPQPYGAVN